MSLPIVRPKTMWRLSPFRHLEALCSVVPTTRFYFLTLSPPQSASRCPLPRKGTNPAVSDGSGYGDSLPSSGDCITREGCVSTAGFILGLFPKFPPFCAWKFSHCFYIGASRMPSIWRSKSAMRTNTIVVSSFRSAQRMVTVSAKVSRKPRATHFLALNTNSNNCPFFTQRQISKSMSPMR